MIKKVFLLLLLFFSLYSYDIQFKGIKDPKILKSLKTTSNVEKLQTVKKINTLRYQIKEYINEMVQTLHGYGYYDAKISYEIKKNLVIFHIEPGIRYLLKSYHIYQCQDLTEFSINLKKLGLQLNSYTNSKELVNSKYALLKYLSEKGYPLSKIEKFDVIANYETKTLHIKLCIEKGPLCHFGSIDIQGLKNIRPRYIYRKIDWKEKEQYSLKKVIETQNRLIDTNLFSSVSITHADSLDDQDLLPMKISFVESKHQNISLGASYATVDGYGVLLGWTHRNIRSMGEILSFKAEIASNAHTGSLTYIKPDFLWFHQNLISEGYVQRDDIHPYLAFTYGLAARIDHRLNRFKYSYGIKAEHIKVSQSANNGIFQLLSFPFYFRYDTTNHLLNPTKGLGIIYIITPAKNIAHKKGSYVKQRITTAVYLPLDETKKLVLALRGQFGSIVGSSLYKIPLTKLFLGGSDDDLRGYKYKTVGPRDNQGGIIGGKSSIYFNVEPRFRLSKIIGLVPFLDIGNVQKNPFPTFKGKWRKSVGIGLRYFSFFGPLRLDTAFPLNRYKGCAKYKIYISIGQTF